METIAMGSIVSVVVGAILTGIVGNMLVQRWQHRNWVRQQRFTGQEKAYLLLKDLCDALAKATAKRVFCMRRLAAAVYDNDQPRTGEVLEEYRAVVKEWNEGLAPFFTRLTFYADYDFTRRLEDSVHGAFVSVGREIERNIRIRKGQATGPLKSVTVDLDRLQSVVVDFNRDLARYAQDRHSEIYFGREMPYRLRYLSYFSNLDLIKALFVTEVDSHTVVRPSFDLPAPLRVW